MSTRFTNPATTISNEETSSSSRQNMVESNIYNSLNSIDDDLIAHDGRIDSIEASSGPVHKGGTNLTGTVSGLNGDLTITFDNTTDICTGVGHGLATAQPLRLINSGGALPTGISAGVTYYAGAISGDTFKLYDTSANATTGGATGKVDFSDNGTGTTTFDGTLLFGSSTNFSTDFVANDYVYVLGLLTRNLVRKVSSVTSGTLMVMTEKFYQTFSGKSFQEAEVVTTPKVFLIPTGSGGTTDFYEIGDVRAWLGSEASLPSGWVKMYGQAISRTTYANLYDKLGTIHGSGDGSTTFNIPDMRGRTLIGIDNMGGGAASRITSASTNGANAVNIGGVGGAQTHTLVSGEMPAHKHQLPVNGGGGGGITLDTLGSGFNGSYNGDTETVGGGGAHSNTQPWMSCNYIMKVQ